MILTDKCKEDFEECFLLNNEHISLSNKFYEEFIEMPLSMQFGVYVDFFQSKGIIVDIQPVYTHNHVSYTEIISFIINIIVIGKEDDNEDLIEVTGRKEARIKAIEEANKIYNE